MKTPEKTTRAGNRSVTRSMSKSPNNKFDKENYRNVAVGHANKENAIKHESKSNKENITPGSPKKENSKTTEKDFLTPMAEGKKREDMLSTTTVSKNTNNDLLYENVGEGDDDLPLKKMNIYVEIFNNERNISESCYKVLELLGATVEKRLNKKCHVMIWKDGTLKSLEKCEKYSIPVVNSLWLEEAMENYQRPDYEKFKAKTPQEMERPFLFGDMKKKKKILTNSANSNKDHSDLSAKKKSKDKEGPDEDWQKSNVSRNLISLSEYFEKQAKNAGAGAAFLSKAIEEESSSFKETNFSYCNSGIDDDSRTLLNKIFEKSVNPLLPKTQSTGNNNNSNSLTTMISVVNNKKSDSHTKKERDSGEFKQGRLDSFFGNKNNKDNNIKKDEPDLKIFEMNKKPVKSVAKPLQKNLQSNEKQNGTLMSYFKKKNLEKQSDENSRGFADLNSQSLNSLQGFENSQLTLNLEKPKVYRIGINMISLDAKKKIEELCNALGTHKLVVEEKKEFKLCDVVVYGDAKLPANFKTCFCLLNNIPLIKSEWVEVSNRECYFTNPSAFENAEYSRPGYDAFHIIREKLLTRLRFHVMTDDLKRNFPNKADIEQMLTKVGAMVVDNVRAADYSLVMKQTAKKPQTVPPHVKCVFIQWLYDSILEGKIQNPAGNAYQLI